MTSCLSNPLMIVSKKVMSRTNADIGMVMYVPTGIHLIAMKIITPAIKKAW